MEYSNELKKTVKQRLKNGEEIEDISEEYGINLEILIEWEKEINKAVEVSKEIRELIKEGKYEEAEEIGNREGNKENAIIQSQMMTIAIQKGEYERAEEIGRRKKFKNSASIQSQMIKLAIRRGDYERAEEIGKRKRFKDSGAIQSQMITLAIQKGEYERVEEIGNREEFKDHASIQSQMIKLAIQKGDYERAEEIGSREEFKENAIIQSQMITIAIQKGDYERAEEIGSREEFKKDEIIQLQMKRMKEMGIETSKNDLTIQEKRKEKETEKPMDPLEEEKMKKQKLLNEMKTKLYHDKISQEDIEDIKKNANISDYERTIMLLAIYSKRKDLKSAKQIAKEYKEKSEEVEKNKIINKIMEKMKSKKTSIFDMGFYDEILNWEIDEELQTAYSEENKKQEETILPKLEQRDTETVKEKVEKIEHPEEKPMKVNPINPTNISKKIKPSNQREEFISRIEVSPNELETIEPKERETNYYSEIKEYLNEKRKELYVKMQSTNYEEQREAIAKYDKMDSLMEKIEENRENKECLHDLHTKILQLKEKETERSIS